MIWLHQRPNRGQEQALYVLLSATGMRVSEALAVENKHFTNNGRTITVEQQVGKDSPNIVKFLKTDAAKRQVDLHPDIAEYLQHYRAENSPVIPYREQNAASIRQLGRSLAYASPHRNEAG